MRVKLGEDLSQVFCGDVTIAVLNVFKFNDSQIMNLLAPTGALIVIVCYYWSARQLFQILSIYANIFSFFFEN